ncbi:MAG: hypothetical protein ACI92I_000425 [Acidimicrobiales bacterium]|jgi:hypothetical protein
MKKQLNNTELYKIAAKNLGLKVERVQKKERKNWEVLMISKGKKFLLVSGAAPGLFPEVSRWNAYMSGRKILAQQILVKIGYNTIPTKEIVISDFTSAKALCDHISIKKYKYPVLIKRNKGQNANMIRLAETNAQIQKIARVHFASKSDFMIQPILDQNEYRILIVNGTVVLLHSKENRFVVGDGNSTIKQLLAEIPAVKKDEVFEAWQHKKQGTKPSTVLSNGERFYFHLTKIPSTDVYETKKIPPAVQKWASQLSKDLSAPVIGLDVFIPGDFKDTESYTIIEINSNPGVHYLAKDCNDNQSAVLIYEKVLKDFFKK